jgi:hypothetical protein
MRDRMIASIAAATFITISQVPPPCYYQPGSPSMLMMVRYGPETEVAASFERLMTLTREAGP